MKSKVLILFLIFTFIKGLAWMFSTPIFQVPDEPSHFSIIQFIGQNNRRPHPRRERRTSLEILRVAEIVNFNWQIQHPVWQGYQENWQQLIKDIPSEKKSEFIKNKYLTSLKRPPLYYYLSTLFYYPFKNQPFLLGFFSVRFFSVIISLLIAFFSYKASKLIFKSNSLALATALLVNLQPMLSYLSASVHYDPLVILITTGFIYSTLLFLKTKESKFIKLSLILTLFGLMVKPDLLALPLSLAIFIPRKKILKASLLGLLGFVSLVVLGQNFNKIASNPQLSSIFDRFLYLANLNELSSHAQFFANLLTSGTIFSSIKSYLSANLASNLAQIFPWYWGVFGWLEKVMPLIVYRVLKIVILISLIGWLKQIFEFKSLSTFMRRSIIFLFTLPFIHLSLVFLNDFKTFVFSGHVFGIQGRYFLVTIAAQMILLVFGLIQFVPKKKHLLLAVALIVAAILLNLIGFNSMYQYFGNVWI